MLRLFGILMIEKVVLITYQIKYKTKYIPPPRTKFKPLIFYHKYNKNLCIVIKPYFLIRDRISKSTRILRNASHKSTFYTVFSLFFLLDGKLKAQNIS